MRPANEGWVRWTSNLAYLKISPESAVFLVNKLAREGKLKIGRVEAAE